MSFVEFIRVILSPHGQQTLFKGWVSLQNSGNKKLRDRALVVSNFRMISIKVSDDEFEVMMDNLIFGCTE
jgi:hypothetical protein